MEYSTVEQICSKEGANARIWCLRAACILGWLRRKDDGGFDGERILNVFGCLTASLFVIPRMRVWEVHEQIQSH